ncbi:ABC transporter ATP-binding protein [Macrococcus hajekii]|uniref:ABC transporter ATP-binding protein n=1 Tax=Macrococcus hajekii TaxID=198482 RepID=A0A4V3BEJ5_9STAP|nr:ABC transporter ATP-binding protein [Macrococcus hajekii]TDM02805.1 ABC transporter ATP-binding protein [Macrococcus hajekii]GGB04048.1 multidrug ABC transporter permease [Macrococcus hajekii]
MSITQRLLQEALRFKKLFIIGFIFLLGAVTAELIGPIIAMKVIDDHVREAKGTIDMAPIMQLLVIYAVVALFNALFSYYQTLYFQNAGSHVIMNLRNKLFRHMQQLPIKYFDNLPAGKVVARITNDTQTILELFTVLLPTYLSGFVNVTAIIIAIFFFNWKVGVAAFMVIPLLIGWLVIYRKLSDQYNHVTREKNSDMNAMLNESINGMTIIQAFNQEEKIQQEFNDLNDEYLRNYSRIIQLDSLTSHNLMGTIRSIIFAVMIYVFGSTYMSSEATLTAGMMYVLVEYLTRLFNPMYNLVNNLSVLEQARVSAVRVYEMLDEKAEVKEDDAVIRLAGDVVFEDVSFAYKGNEYVLEHINIHARRGETVALVGHTGSGKSSIMNLLFRFYDPSKGRILMDGIDSKTVTKTSLREHMGIVLQDPYLYSGTILSNITLNDPKISRERAIEALNSVGGDRVLDGLELGIDTPVTEKGNTFSSGQRQLISFARALAFDPAILILDEATASIDSETESIIQRAMDVLKEGRTTFIIAHRLSTIKNAEQIVVLDKGHIVEHGNHRTLIGLGGQYAKMYQLQSAQN